MRTTDDLSPEQAREVENLTMILQAEGPDEFPTGYYEHLARERVTEAYTIKLARKVTEAHDRFHQAETKRLKARRALAEAQEAEDEAGQAAAAARSALIEWLS